MTNNSVKACTPNSSVVKAPGSDARDRGFEPHFVHFVFCCCQQYQRAQTAHTHCANTHTHDASSMFMHTHPATSSTDNIHAHSGNIYTQATSIHITYTSHTRIRMHTIGAKSAQGSCRSYVGVHHQDAILTDSTKCSAIDHVHTDSMSACMYCMHRAMFIRVLVHCRNRRELPRFRAVFHTSLCEGNPIQVPVWRESDTFTVWGNPYKFLLEQISIHFLFEGFPIQSLFRGFRIQVPIWTNPIHCLLTELPYKRYSIKTIQTRCLNVVTPPLNVIVK